MVILKPFYYSHYGQNTLSRIKIVDHKKPAQKDLFYEANNTKMPENDYYYYYKIILFFQLLWMSSNSLKVVSEIL